MWNKWKRKIQNFIWKEDKVKKDTFEGKTDYKIDKTNQVKTKMVYKYPNEQSFRFPVIPDKPKIKKTTEKPAYQRRQEPMARNETYEQPNEVEEKSYNKPVERKIKTKDKPPFKPSQVASPIYGYQKREQETDIDNVPAFIRKQRVDEEVKLETKEISNLDDEKQPKKSNCDEQNVSPITIKQDQRDNLQSDVNNEPYFEQIESISQQNTHLNETLNVKAEKRNVEQNSGITKKTRSERRDENSKDTNSNTTSPYNVIMTPRDKKILFDKKKASERHYSEPKEVNRVDLNNAREPFPNYLLNDPVMKSDTNDEWVENQKDLLEETLKHFNVKAQVVNATQGPSVTRFEVKPELGVKVSRIRNLSDDLKLNMAAKDIRIEAPIPGKNTVGIEVPNPIAQMVGLQEIFETEAFKKSESPLTVALGLDIEGDAIITNLQKMPHGLIAGATGSGKSVCINTILISLLYKASHKDVRLLLIDPKMVELTQYNGIPHLVSPVITDVKAATAALKWAVQEMEKRYEKFVHEGVRDIAKYNQKALNNGYEKMPFIVIVIDELADLMMISPQDVENSISRIAQKARACGIHLLLATQRPSVDVITGLIKANIPTRIAFSVSSQVDSRTILDVGGAEKLLGKGDMLFTESGAGKSIRLQGAFVSDEEIDRVTDHARSIASPTYLFEQESLLEEMAIVEEEDELLQDVIDFVMKQNGASTSLLQRNFKIGYNRAARLIDSLEQKGIISGQKGSKPRDVLMTQSQINELNEQQSEII